MIQRYLSVNGYADQFTNDDVNRFIAYFDLDNDLRLKYHDWLQVVLTCENSVLRATTTQRNQKLMGEGEELSTRVERQMSMLLFKEIQFHQKWEELKHTCKNAMDFTC